MFPFIFENSPLPFIIAFINQYSSWNKHFLKSTCNTLGVASTFNLLHTAWQGIFPFETLLWHVKQIYNLLSKVVVAYSSF